MAKQMVNKSLLFNVGDHVTITTTELLQDGAILNGLKGTVISNLDKNNIIVSTIKGNIPFAESELKKVI